MIKIIKRAIALYLLLFAINIYAQSTAVSGLYRYKLDNGLELYVMENDAAPLAYIEIAIKAGAIAQTQTSAGLFHLYEHMMFKGNSLYTSSESVQEEMSHLGVTNYNGSTSVDYINYFFTIPCDMVKEGLQFWSAAIRSPLMKADEFEREKEVVIAEIQGNYSNPASIAYAAISKNMFPQYPWRLDAGGVIYNIKNATLDSMQSIKDIYYVPDNAALFVGGAVKHEEVYNLVNSIYGSWQKTGKARTLSPVPTKTPVRQNKYLIYANPQIPPEMTSVYYCLRGPDTQVDEIDTYGIDLLIALSEIPGGKFKSIITKDEKLKFHSDEYFDFSYTTQKASGQIVFSSMLSNEDDFKTCVSRVNYLVQEKLPYLAKSIISTPDFFSKEDISSSKKAKAKEKKYSIESASDYLSILRYWWAVCNFDYAINYEKRFASSTKKDIDNILKRYIIDKAGIVLVQVNPATFTSQKDEFDKAGWTVITRDNAFWFLGE